MAKEKSKIREVGGGKRNIAKANKQIKAMKSKIKRWERYKAEGKKTAKKSRRRGWDTSGLKKHVELLSSLIKK